MKDGAGSSKVATSSTDYTTSTATTTKSAGADASPNNMPQVTAAVKKLKKQQYKEVQRRTRLCNTSVHIRKPIWLTGTSGTMKEQTLPALMKTTGDATGKV